MISKSGGPHGCSQTVQRALDDQVARRNSWAIPKRYATRQDLFSPRRVRMVAGPDTSIYQREWAG